MSTPTLAPPAPQETAPRASDGPAAVTTEHAPPSARAGFRADIQGLRAVAVLLVVLFHAGVPGLAGGFVGVDVFFVISGFLITGLIRKEVDRTGRLRFGLFYARRARRLLPSAAVVVVATVLMAWAWGPVLQFRTTATDAFFAAFYGINFRLAARGVDYQNATGPESPLQHFWSLAVEEQFYLVWPVLLLVAALLFRRHRAGGSVIVIAAVTAASLWYSVHLTQAAAPAAYFSVFTRGWEFGVGALVGLSGAALVQVPALMRNLLAWAGLVMIVTSAFVFDASTPFPGDAALVPVLGAAAMLAGTAGRASTERLLGRRPFQLVGTLSYGWYLWHWPLLLLVPAAFGETFGWLRNLEVCVLALWLAAVTYLLLEAMARKPLPSARSWLLKGLAISAAAGAVALLIPLVIPGVRTAGAPVAPLAVNAAGITALTTAIDTSVGRKTVPSNLQPTLTAAADDVPDTTKNCHLSFTATVSPPCVFGDVRSSKTVVLFGDSHAQQWNAAVDDAAKAAGYRVVAWTKSACPIADLDVTSSVLHRVYTECTTWRNNTIARIAAMHPAVVVASQSDTVPGRDMSDQTWADATAHTVSTLEADADRVVFLADTPIPTGNVPTCVAAHLGDVQACSWNAAKAYTGAAVYEQRHTDVSSAVSATGARVVDPKELMCNASRCPVVIANVLVYRDESHITNTFSRTVGPLFIDLLQLH